MQFHDLQAGGPYFEVELGRFDGLRSKASDVNGRLPEPGFNLNQLNSLFASNGLTQTEMIALSGNARASHFPNQRVPAKQFLNMCHAMRHDLNLCSLVNTILLSLKYHGYNFHASSRFNF